MGNRIMVTLVCFLLVGLISAAVQCGSTEWEPASEAELARFSSFDELRDFVTKSTEFYYKSQGVPRASLAWDQGALSVLEGGDGAYGGSVDYSTTNIQVEGVDEADIVKTDGEFIYLVSENRIIIVKAHPAEEARVLSEIELDETPEGIFVNGDKLVVLTGGYGVFILERGEEKLGLPEPEMEQGPQSSIKVYDITDRESPYLTREIDVDGQYVGSRMVGDYVYAVINEQTYDYDNEIGLPRIDLGDGATEIPASEIYYSNIPDSWYVYTTIVAVNAQDDDREPTYETLLLGSSSNIYVSPNNIYITSTRWQNSGDYSETTAIHRIHIDEDRIEYQVSGEAPGRLLNQFSMDEYRGFFRVATTTTGSGAGVGGAAVGPDASVFLSPNTTANHIYVLDMDLDIVGRLEDLAPGESIYSARFMGDRSYLVTFQKIDPLFVIDLKDPYEPKVLGELKITGYSDYLHPYDENHVIGIGKEAVAVEQRDFAWYQGVKISLFDVTDVENPVEIAKYEIGDRGTDSPILRDHKALLFDKSRNLLVMPVLVAEIDQGKYPYGLEPSAYGEPVWQGAYVFDISLDEGLELKGRITHYEDYVDQMKGYYSTSYLYSVERSLYIDDVLYTISDAMVRMNNLETLDHIGDVELR